MHRSLRHALRLALLTLALPILGCDLSWLTVEIPDFSTKHVEGVWIWRLSPQTNQYQRDTQIVFGSVITVTSGQILSYSTNLPTGGTLTEGIARDPAHPDIVTLKLGFVRGAPGVFKVSTYNAAGESPLSAQGESL